MVLQYDSGVLHLCLDRRYSYKKDDNIIILNHRARKLRKHYPLADHIVARFKLNVMEGGHFALHNNLPKQNVFVWTNVVLGKVFMGVLGDGGGGNVLSITF